MISDANFFNQLPNSFNQQIKQKELAEKDVELWIKREDLIHPLVSGNKFRKLKYNLLQAKNNKKNTLLTFGGAFSNHIVATAVAAQKMGMKSIGVIRGEELANDFKNLLQTNFTIRTAFEHGMKFHFVNRTDFRNKNKADFIKYLEEKFGEFYLIPEGGTNKLAVVGCEEILSETDNQFDVVCCAVGTGGTISGIINSAKQHQKILGFSALKGDFLNEEIKKYTHKHQWQLITQYHFGGYAKYTLEFINFLNNFTKETQIPLDPIYTGKMIFGILDLVKANFFSKGTKILAIHTGGLQGIQGFNEQLKKKNHQLITTL